jgi:hypothetical protein
VLDEMKRKHEHELKTKRSGQTVEEIELYIVMQKERNTGMNGLGC